MFNLRDANVLQKLRQLMSRLDMMGALLCTHHQARTARATQHICAGGCSIWHMLA